MVFQANQGHRDLEKETQPRSFFMVMCSVANVKNMLECERGFLKIFSNFMFTKAFTCQPEDTERDLSAGMELDVSLSQKFCFCFFVVL